MRHLDKIKKCLALSKSGCKHEALQALKHAQLLMKKYNVSDYDLMLHNMASKKSFERVPAKPQSFVTNLAFCVGSAFGVKPIITSSFLNRRCIEFLGSNAHVEVATYSFDVCLRQLRFARKQYLKTLHKNCKPTTRIERADLFCLGWVSAISDNLPVFELDADQLASLELYYDEQTKGLVTTRSKSVNSSNKRNQESYYDGLVKGRSFSVNTPVNGESVKRLN